MAKLEKRAAKVVVRHEATFTLTLNEKEAEILAAVLGRVSGDYELSHRKDTAAMLDLLESAGVEYYDRDISNSLTGGVDFADVPTVSQWFKEGEA